MNHLQKSLLLFLSAWAITGFVSCKKQLQEINVNPNAVENPDPDYLLTGAMQSAVDAYWNVSTANPSNLFVQYWAAIQYTDNDRYIYTSSGFQSLWTSLYSGSIVNLNKVVELAREKEQPNHEAVAVIFRSWVYCLLTDAFGAVPYSEAMAIEENITPAYDPQQAVYTGLLADLKAATDLLDPNGETVSGDLLYDGKPALWAKWARSLQLRIALRIADQDPEQARSVLQALAPAEGGLISSNADNAVLNYLNPPNDNPLAELFLTRDDYRISKTMVDRLRDLDDPRLPVYAAPTADPTPQTYVGVPNGLLVGEASELGLSKTSLPGTAFLDTHAPAVLMSYAEVLFDRAEAAARGLTSGDPAALYQQAIAASLQQYGIGDAQVQRYLAQPEVQYAPDQFKKSIGVQKWIALFGQGLEAFAEWRRLDYPQLQPAKAGVLNGKMPLRFIYPGTEQSLNAKSYKQAVSQQGADVLTTSLWFDVQ